MPTTPTAAVVIGDSIVDQAAMTFHQRLDPSCAVTISALGGMRADQRADDPDLLALAAGGGTNAVVIDLGTNDVLQGTPPARTVEAIGRIASAFAPASVLVVTVTEGIFGNGSPVLRDRSVALNRLLRATAAERGWTVVPWDLIVRRYVEAGQPLGPITSDTVHPTFTGRWLLADACARALRAPARPGPAEHPHEPRARSAGRPGPVQDPTRPDHLGAPVNPRNPRTPRSPRDLRNPALRPDDLLAGHPPALAIFRRIAEVVEQLGPVEVRTSKSQIAFRRRRNFALVWRPGQYLAHPDAPLVLSIALGRHDRSARWKEVVQPSPTQWMHHLELHDVDDVDDQVVDWLREAADRAGVRR